jgi:hypothetical protein
MPKADSSRQPLSAAFLFLFTSFSLTIAYQVHRPVEIDMGSGPASAPFVDNFHDAEGNYRWSRERSCVIVPDPGAGARGRIELELSAFRPRGLNLPIVIIESGPERQRLEMKRGLHTVSLAATPQGIWSSDLIACVRSETFRPGPADRRSLGVRVHRVRWVAEDGLALTVPAFRQILLSGFAVLFLWGIFGQVGLRARIALSSSVAVALAFGVAYALIRPVAAVGALPLLILAALVYVTVRCLPSPAMSVVRYGSRTVTCWFQGFRVLGRWPTLALVFLGAVLVTFAYLTRPTLTIDLGSGREADLANRFASYDAESGVRFRKALRGAEINLRDFGGGPPWRISVTASLPGGGGQVLPLLTVGGVEANAALGDEWITESLVVETSSGWDSGVLVEFPANGILVHRVDIDRGRSYPPLRIIVALVVAALAIVVIGGSLGQNSGWCFVAGATMLLLECLAVYLDPVLSVPFSATFAGICLLGTVVAALGGGLLAALRTKGLDFKQGPYVITTVAFGFIIWLAAMSSPLYHGLHFVYHSNIAEEIWKGKFFVFYLPHPENILSREAQWDGLVVPYSCLYHTLVAPLTAFPAVWFQLFHKIFQAGLLAMTTLLAALAAERLAGGKACLWTAILLVSASSIYQLLALSHFLTVFGCWGSTVALVYIIFVWGRLDRAPYWWGGVGLIALAFLSYTASLLFTGVTIAVALLLLARVNRRQSRLFLTCSIAATVAALMLYYVHWILPFIRESIPILLSSGEADPIPLVSRLGQIPGKLTYSFGSVWIPLTGLLGVGIVVTRSRDEARFVLLAWASILVLFSGPDLFFNFILKHHYFTIVPISVGGGALLDFMMRRGGWLRWSAVGMLFYALTIGAVAAFRLAMGTMQ